MKNIVSRTWPLFFGLGMLMIGNGLQGTLLGIRAGIEDFSVLTTGAIMSAYYIGFLFGSWNVPKLIDSVGHIRVFAAMASLASTTVLVHGVLVDPVVWCAVRVVSGFSFAGLFLVTESWLNDASTNKTRGAIMGLYMVVTYVGMAVGQVLLNIAAPESMELFIIVSVLVSIALVPVSLSRRPAPDFSVSEPISVQAIWRRSPLGIFGVFVSGAAVAAIFSIAPVYAVEIGLGNAAISGLMAAFLIGSVLCQMPVAMISDRMDRRRVIIALCLVSAVISLLTILNDMPISALFLVMAMLGGASLPIYGQCASHINDHLSPRQFVASSSTILLSNGAGAAFGPLMVTGAMQIFGSVGFGVFNALCFAAIAVFGIYRSFRSDSVPLEDQGDSIIMPARGSAFDIYSEET